MAYIRLLVDLVYFLLLVSVTSLIKGGECLCINKLVTESLLDVLVL